MTRNGRVAVVTGAGRGFGQAIAGRLAADGLHVVLFDIDQADETAEMVERAGRSALVVTGDVSDADAVEELANEVTARFGRCDVLVNNAATATLSSFEDLDFETWRRVLAVNLDGMFLTCKAFVPRMKETGFGRIINVSSNTLGLVIGWFPHYLTSKAGVVGLTRALASELGEHGVTVNSVAPGHTETPGTTEMLGDGGRDAFAAMAAQQAIKRPQRTDDLAGVVSFLASDDAAFITGQTLMVDGGLVRL